MSHTIAPRSEKEAFQDIPLEDFPPQYESAVNAELRRFNDAEAHQTKPDLHNRPKQSRKRRYIIIGCAVTGILAVLAIMAGVVATYLSAQRPVRSPAPPQTQLPSSIAETPSQISPLSVRSTTATTTATAFATVTVTATRSIAAGFAPIRATEISSTTVTSTSTPPGSGILTVASTVHTTVESRIISYLTESDTSFFRLLPSTSTLSYASTATIMVGVPNMASAGSALLTSTAPAVINSSSTKASHHTISVGEKTWLDSSGFTTVTSTATPPASQLNAAAKPTSTKKGGLINFCGVPGEACSD
ncbi:hypothetical protein LTS14_003411 [Recurvomyces mirabilis]|uniref:uncharacterized protein n=1 Tax=Recurvomyces mirabilis TaxID=574656 RepID=UPI002DE0E6BA|nr:hypothetical protein LTS14_003411 [Recurvomyces mirabilis]